SGKHILKLAFINDMMIDKDHDRNVSVYRIEILKPTAGSN
ncbi:unnamed protein product, partial [marine sediment metagenome]